MPVFFSSPLAFHHAGLLLSFTPTSSRRHGLLVLLDLHLGRLVVDHTGQLIGVAEVDGSLERGSHRNTDNIFWLHMISIRALCDVARQRQALDVFNGHHVLCVIQWWREILRTEAIEATREAIGDAVKWIIQPVIEILVPIGMACFQQSVAHVDLEAPKVHGEQREREREMSPCTGLHAISTETYKKDVYCYNVV